ncbi:MAG: hypothetical protein WEC15_06985 [Flavobacteriales bacterium]
MRYIHTFLLTIGLVCLIPVGVLAERGTLKADCIIQIKGTKTQQTRLTVMPGTTPAYVLTPTSMHFILDLVLDETYLLTFEHPNCVTKQLYVDTSVPLDQRRKDFDFPLMVVLEHHVEAFSYAGPVGFIYYDHSLTGFSYHTEYAITINKRFGERMVELERTGIDPRTAIQGYTASTTRALPVSVEPQKEIPMPQWSTLAPTVAHVAPMVHRLGNAKSMAHGYEETAMQAESPQPIVPVIGLLMPVVPTTAPPHVSVLRKVDVPEVMDVNTSVELNIAPREKPIPDQDISWQLIVEERSLTTIIRFADKDERRTEYRRVLYSSGAAYYFHDGRSISEYSYDQGTAVVRQVAQVGGNGTRLQQ